MKRPALLTVALCGVLCCRLMALPPSAAGSAAENRISVQSKNFFLVGNASEKDIRQVAVRLEQFREVFGRLFNRARLNSQSPIHVIVFKSRADYRPFMPVYRGKVSEVGGYYQPGEDVSYITLTSEFAESNPYSIIFHEYVHAITRDNLGPLPSWFNEGLAEYYSTFEISGGDQKVLLGKPIAHHVYLLRDKKFMPLERLFAVDHASAEYNENDRKGLFYAESWALVHYLMLGRNGARYPQLLQFLQLLDTGAAVGECFQKAFQTDYATLEKELRDYISRDSYPATSYTFDQKLRFDATLTSAPITEAEWQYQLGDLLRHSGRAESEQYLERALQLDPNLTAAHAALGMQRMQQGKFDEAKEHLQRALAVASNAPEKPSNYLAHYYYAFTLSREGADHNLIRGYTPEQARLMRAELQKAIALNPDFAESYHLLAFVNFITGEQLEESVALLKRAIALAPSRQDYQLQLANVLLRLNKLAEAQQLLATTVRTAADPQLRDQAGTLLASVERQIKFQAEYEMQARAQHAATRPDEPADKAASSRLIGALSRPTLRRRTEGDKMQGQLVRIDCADSSVVLTVKGADRIYRFQAASLERVSFVSYSPEISSELACAELKKPLPVIIIYRASTDAKSQSDGEPLSVEFIKPE